MKKRPIKMADQIFIAMAKFDFNAPVETITFYEDDTDEESFPTPKKIKLEDENIKDCPSECDSHKKKVISSVDSEEELQRVKITVNDCIIEYNLSDVKKASNPQLFTNTNAINDDKININHKENERKNKTVVDKPTRFSDEHVTVTEQTLPDQVNTVSSLNNNENNNDKQKSDMEVMSSYLKKLMDTVSEYLIIILRAHRLYLHAERIGNHHTIEKWKEHYIQVKYHYFKLAFIIVETIFIPQVKFGTFAQSFIECTMRLASRKLIRCTYEQIEPLYLEMLEWTKEKSRKFKNFALFYMATYLGTQSKKPSTESPNRQQNINTQQIHQSPTNPFINCRPRQNTLDEYQRRYPVLGSMIRSNIPNYEESVHPQGARNSDHVLNNNNGRAHPNFTENYGYYNYPNRSNSGYNPRTLSEPYSCPNCVYCQQSQRNAIREQNRPIPVTSQIPTVDLRYN